MYVFSCNNTHHQLPNGTWLGSNGGECGSYWTAIPFMVTYIIITYLFIINMYIAVILENYTQVSLGKFSCQWQVLK